MSNNKLTPEEKAEQARIEAEAKAKIEAEAKARVAAEKKLKDQQAAQARADEKARVDEKAKHDAHMNERIAVIFDGGEENADDITASFAGVAYQYKRNRVVHVPRKVLINCFDNAIATRIEHDEQGKPLPPTHYKRYGYSLAP